MIFEDRVAGIEPFSMLDFQDKLCGILFYNGCHLHCPYCYNAELVRGTAKTLPHKEVSTFLTTRTNKLDGIVFSGGECSLWGDKLVEDIVYTKNLGYQIKLDTNGVNPVLVQYLINLNLLDYVALDVKCPENKSSLFMPASKFYYNFKETFRILQQSGIAFETRTTVHTALIDENDVNEILKMLESWGYNGTHYIQFFFQPSNTKTLKQIKKPMRHFDTTLVNSSIPVSYRNIEGNP